MKTTVFSIITAFSGISFTGCATANSAMVLAGRDQRDIYPVERISGGSGKIAAAHARKDARGVFVSGYVEKLGSGGVTAAWSHIDVVVLDSEGRPSQKVATTFFPSDVPNTLRGITGRSRYFVRLPSPPPAGSTVQVAFHQTPMSRCESARKL